MHALIAFSPPFYITLRWKQLFCFLMRCSLVFSFFWLEILGFSGKHWCFYKVFEFFEWTQFIYVGWYCLTKFASFLSFFHYKPFLNILFLINRISIKLVLTRKHSILLLINFLYKSLDRNEIAQKRSQLADHCSCNEWSFCMWPFNDDQWIVGFDSGLF
jgi:hypothetical protein